MIVRPPCEQTLPDDDEVKFKEFNALMAEMVEEQASLDDLRWAVFMRGEIEPPSELIVRRNLFVAQIYFFY